MRSRVALLGVAVSAFMALAVFLMTLVWQTSHGRLPAVVLVIAVMMLADRLSLRLVGPKGPLAIWRVTLLFVPVFVLTMIDRFWSSIYGSQPLTLGEISFDELEIGAILVGGLLMTPLLWFVGRWIPSWRALGWIAISASIFFTGCETMKRRWAPTPERYVASLSVVGTFPAVTLPTTEVHRPLDNPTNDEAYPFRFEQATPWFHGVRFCDNTSCFLYFTSSTERFPETFDMARFPKPYATVQAFGSEDVSLSRDGAGVLVARASKTGARTWLDETTLESLYQPFRLSTRLALPTPILITSLLGILIAIVAMVRGPRRLKRVYGVFAAWEPARMTADGLIHFDDGSAPAQPPPGVIHAQRDVLVLASKDTSPSFRDAGVRTVTRVFHGTKTDLLDLSSDLDKASVAFAMACVLICATPIFAGLYLGM